MSKPKYPATDRLKLYFPVPGGSIQQVTSSVGNATVGIPFSSCLVEEVPDIFQQLLFPTLIKNNRRDGSYICRGGPSDWKGEARGASYKVRRCGGWQGRKGAHWEQIWREGFLG
jgi:hypothetical protein